jgi:hypothetical protein
MMKFANRALAGASAALLPVVVFAQAVPVDVSDAVDQLETIGTTVTLVGGALLVVAAIAVGVKWAKASIFG